MYWNCKFLFTDENVHSRNLNGFFFHSSKHNFHSGIIFFLLLSLYRTQFLNIFSKYNGSIEHSSFLIWHALAFECWHINQFLTWYAERFDGSWKGMLIICYTIICTHILNAQQLSNHFSTVCSAEPTESFGECLFGASVENCRM